MDGSAEPERWTEVADGVLVLRHDRDGVDVTCTAVVGADGVTVVDTLGSPRDAAVARSALAQITGLPVVAIVLTHAHWDHTFGTRAFTGPHRTGPGADPHGTAPGAGPGVPLVHGHHRLAAHLEQHEARILRARADGALGPRQPGDWDDVVLGRPDVAVAARTVIRPGGRELVLVPLPTAHTTCDLVVHVPDAGVWVVGDVVEESGDPCVEDDSDVSGWAAVLASLASCLQPADVVVPGHGACVDRTFVEAQSRVLHELADVP